MVTGSVEEQEITPPQSTRRKGPDPVLLRAKSWSPEAQIVAKTIKNLHSEKLVPYDDMLILYRVKHTHIVGVVDTLKYILNKYGIPFTWVT
ncbi:hypothetical protein [Halobacillus hunanensis]|uniref:hypothetical protein n=1 Tax=Halobacillus hunanensis TaxID=578214 RepID=UPI0009A8E44E|nr:hypothetical protein [Halobacillus hunanensis]